MFLKSLCLILILSVSLANIHEIEAYFRHTNHFLSPKEPFGLTNIQDRNTLINQLEQGVVKLMSYFSPSTGVWNDPNCVRQGSCVNGTGWWYWGNALHVLADYQKYASGRSDYSSYFDGIFSKNLNEMTSAGYFDDEGWWGLALLHLYKTTNNQTFFDQAKNIANDMKNRGQQTVCKGSGGIFWDAAKTQVGAIANELLLSLSARIALLNDTNGEYKDIALGVWNWIEGSGLVVNNNSLIDHYNVINQNTCGDLVTWSFTYTNGVVLSGLVDLYKLTGNTSYLDMANNIAYAAIERFAPRGIINDDYSNNDPSSLAEDAFLFKGIFADNLAYLALNTKDSTLKTKITTLLNNNYSLLIFNQGAGGVYGYLWENKTGANNPADIVTHISALYLIDSALQLSS